MFNFLLAHLAEGHESLCHGAASVRRQLFPSNDFSSRTARPISTKLGRQHAWVMGIQICWNKGTGPFWGPLRGNIKKILINLQNYSGNEPLVEIHW